VGFSTAGEQVSRNTLLYIFSDNISTEYVTILSIMVVMTVWDFVTGILFGIVVSCESLVFVPQVFGQIDVQASFLLYKTRREGTYVLCILVIQRCLLFVGQGCKEHIFAMLPNRRLFFACRVSAYWVHLHYDV